jgi:hypothetical protein
VNRTDQKRKEIRSKYTAQEKRTQFGDEVPLTKGDGDNESWRLTILFAEDRDFGVPFFPKLQAVAAQCYKCASLKGLA